MKNKQMWGVLVCIALVAVIGFTFVACDNGADIDENPGIGGTYFFTASDEIYVLVVSDDGEYVLTVIGAGTNSGKTSTGTAKKSGGTYTLTPSSTEADSFTVTVNASGVSGVNGTITFDDGETQEVSGEVEVVPPEEVPVEYRWSIWRDPSSTATLNENGFSVDNDGKVTITTGGTPEPQGVNNKWQAWKITADYKYTSTANTAYKYVIEASKQGTGERRMNVQYYEDNATATYLGQSFELTEEPTEYTIYGQRLPKQGEPVRFQCADAIGTFYLKIISIEEYEPGEVTITNFRGTSGLRAGKWIMGDAYYYVDGEWVDIEFDGFNIPATGDFKTVSVYNRVWIQESEDDGYYERTTPFTGSGTVEPGHLSINQWGGNTPDLFHVNKVAITFTNGKATINFGTQMMKYEDFEWDDWGTPQPPGGGGDTPKSDG